jgi:hypothetical protein
MSLTTTIYNTAGEPFTFTFEYEVDLSRPFSVIVKRPMFLDESFGDGWQDDLVKALHEELMFDFELKII